MAVWKFEVEKEHAVAVVTAQRRQLAQVWACAASLSMSALVRRSACDEPCFTFMRVLFVALTGMCPAWKHAHHSGKGASNGISQPAPHVTLWRTYVPCTIHPHHPSPPPPSPRARTHLTCTPCGSPSLITNIEQSARTTSTHRPACITHMFNEATPPSNCDGLGIQLALFCLSSH